MGFGRVTLATRDTEVTHRASARPAFELLHDQRPSLEKEPGAVLA